MKTLQQEIVEGLKKSAVDYRAIAMACCVGVFPRRFYEENINNAVEMEQLAAKVESARCKNCKSFMEYYVQASNYMRITTSCREGFAISPKKTDGCWHFEPKEI